MAENTNNNFMASGVGELIAAKCPEFRVADKVLQGNPNSNQCKNQALRPRPGAYFGQRTFISINI